MNNPYPVTSGHCDRRQLLRAAACGFGSVALQGILSSLVRAAGGPLAAHAPHFAPRAKRMIFLFIQGGPSQLDLFDPKPELEKWHGKPLPESMTSQLKLAFIKPNAAVLASPRIFTPAGQSGAEFSDGSLIADPLSPSSGPATCPASVGRK